MEDYYKQVLSEWKKDEDNIKGELKEIGDEIKVVGTEIRDVKKILHGLTAAAVTNRKESSEEGELR